MKDLERSIRAMYARRELPKVIGGVIAALCFIGALTALFGRKRNDD